jgi:hypothetical protein
MHVKNTKQCYLRVLCAWSSNSWRQWTDGASVENSIGTLKKLPPRDAYVVENPKASFDLCLLLSCDNTAKVQV